MNKLVNLSLIIWMSFTSVVVNAQIEALDRVVALVDEDVVLVSELVRRTNSIAEQIKARKQTLPPMDKLQEQVLDRLISESLQLQMAKRVGVRVSDAELDSAIERIAADSQITVEELRQGVTTESTSWAIFREDIRNEIMVSRARNGSVSRRIKISDKEVDSLLIQINEEGENRTQYSIGHILLPLSESATPEVIAKTRSLAEKLVSELRADANFQEYAVTYSAGENALSGGSLGWRTLTQLPSLFAGSVKNMKVGDVSEPLRSGSGLHILHLSETKGGFETHEVLQTHARHILISPNAIMDDKAAKEKLLLVRQRIINGESFAELAVEFSDDKNTPEGDLGWSEPGKFVPEFTHSMESLAINEMSEPIRTEYGWHIIEVIGRRNQDQTEEKKREGAYRVLHNRKFEEEAQIWLRELKDQAYIRIINDK